MSGTIGLLRDDDTRFPSPLEPCNARPDSLIPHRPSDLHGKGLPDSIILNALSCQWSSYLHCLEGSSLLCRTLIIDFVVNVSLLRSSRVTTTFCWRCHTHCLFLTAVVWRFSFRYVSLFFHVSIDHHVVRVTVGIAVMFELSFTRAYR